MHVDTVANAVQQAADSVIIADRDGIITYVNPAFEIMTGFSRQQAIGQTPALLRSGVHTPSFYASLWNTILAGRPFSAVITNRTRDGRLFDEEQTISPMRDAAGDVTHFISIGRDVTNARRTEAARVHQLLEQEASRVVTLLHAEAGQLLTSAHLTLCAMTVDRPEALPRDVESVRGVLDRVEALLRRAAHGAQPRVIADLGLVDAVRYLAEDCTARTGVVFTIDSAIDRRCPAASETLVYRFVQETLAAVPRTTRPSHARIQLRREVQGRRAQDETLSCTIRLADRGEAFSAPFSERDGGVGLRLVRDRLESVGGTLTSGAADGKVELQATVPLGA